MWYHHVVTPHCLQLFVVFNLNFQMDLLDRQVAEFVFGTNSPFSIVENKSFVKLMHDLRPGYKPPSRERIGGDLLDKVHPAFIFLCYFSYQMVINDLTSNTIY